MIIEHGKTLRNTALTALFISILIALVWNSLNYANIEAPDPSLFSSIGFHIFKGKVMYRDVWDMKPPVIFLLNALAICSGGCKLQAIRSMEYILGSFGILFFFWIILKSFKNRLLAFFSSLLFLLFFYHPNIIAKGNYSEEYGAIFLIIAIYFVIFAREKGKTCAPKALLPAFTSGLFFSLAVLTKEPFLISSIPWALYLLVRKKNSVWKIETKLALHFAFGIFLPILIFMFYLIKNGAFYHLLDIGRYSLQYVEPMKTDIFFISGIYRNFFPAMQKLYSVTYLGMAVVLLGVIGGCYEPFCKHYNYFPRAALISLLFDYYATSLGPWNLFHYYIQMVPSFILVSTCGIAFLVHSLNKLKTHRRKMQIGILIISLFLCSQDMHHVEDYVKRLTAQPVKTQDSRLVQYIKQNSSEKDFIWITSLMFSHLYFQTERLSPIRYIFSSCVFFTGYLRLGIKGEKVRYILSELEKTPPKFIISYYHVLSHRCSKPMAIVKWIKRNYVRNLRFKALYVRKSSDLGKSILQRQAHSHRRRRKHRIRKISWHA